MHPCTSILVTLYNRHSTFAFFPASFFMYFFYIIILFWILSYLLASLIFSLFYLLFSKFSCHDLLQPFYPDFYFSLLSCRCYDAFILLLRHYTFFSQQFSIFPCINSLFQTSTITCFCLLVSLLRFFLSL